MDDKRSRREDGGQLGMLGGWGRLQSSAGQRPVLKSEGQQRPWGVQDVTPSPRGAPEDQGAPSGAGRGVWYRNSKGGSTRAKGEGQVADSSSPTRCLTHIQCMLHFALTAPILTGFPGGTVPLLCPPRRHTVRVQPGSRSHTQDGAL